MDKGSGTMSKDRKRKHIIFICTHNSARSQMAEGFLNSLYGDKYEAFSAGTEPSHVKPHAIKVMAEIGIDISNYRAKSVFEFPEAQMDLAVTVCDKAKETCPFFPAKAVLHHPFADPETFTGSEDEILEKFRKLRDEIKTWVEQFFSDEDAIDDYKNKSTVISFKE